MSLHGLHQGASCFSLFLLDRAVNVSDLDVCAREPERVHVQQLQRRRPAPLEHAIHAHAIPAEVAQVEVAARLGPGCADGSGAAPPWPPPPGGVKISRWRREMKLKRPRLTSTEPCDEFRPMVTERFFIRYSNSRPSRRSIAQPPSGDPPPPATPPLAGGPPVPGSAAAATMALRGPRPPSNTATELRAERGRGPSEAAGRRATSGGEGQDTRSVPAPGHD